MTRTIHEWNALRDALRDTELRMIAALGDLAAAHELLDEWDVPTHDPHGAKLTLYGRLLAMKEATK